MHLVLCYLNTYIIVAVGLSGILKGKQKLGVTFNSDKLKALVVKNSILHDFGSGKVSRIHETFLMELQLFGWRHFSKTEVVQNFLTTTLGCQIDECTRLFGTKET